MGNLAPHEKQALFADHLETLRGKRVDALERLFEQHAKALDTSFADIYPTIVADKAVSHLHVSPEQIEALFEAWQRRRRVTARNDFDAMLTESAFVDYWARLRKVRSRLAKWGHSGLDACPQEATDRKADETARKALAGDDEEAASADQADIRQMAATIDLKDMHAVLRNDARYRAFDYDPDARESWIRDHIDSLSGHATTVHQKR
jgi:transcription elongation regulator 1